MDNSHPLLPGPRPPSNFLPSSYPPAPRRWSAHPSTSQSRAKYISPDPSPIAENFAQQPRLPPLETQLKPTDYHGHGQHTRDVGPLIRPGRHPQIEIDPYFYPFIPQHPPAPPQARQRKSTRKVDGKQPTFLTKLYQILEQTEYHHIIRWDEAGKVIIIEKPDELADKILPLVYRQSRFASFSRQLNIYGFMRKVSLRHIDKDICDPDASTWSHPFLCRSSTPSEIQGFKRRVPPRPSQSAKRRASIGSAYDDQMLGLSPTSSEGSYHSPPDAYQPHLLADLDEDQPTNFNHPSFNASPFDASPVAAPEFDGRSNSFGQHIAARPIPQPNNSQNFVLPGFAASISSLFLDKSVSDAVPASAPANVGSFPNGALRIAQGHIRTRSVQGEPPSATLFSPSSPLARSSWLPEKLEPDMRGDGGVPTYETSDPSTWVRRGFTDLHTGAIVAPPTDRFGSVPLSVPRDFAPSGLSAQQQQQQQQQQQNQAPVDNITSQATVSPGVYQYGFGAPAYKLSTTSSKPRAVPMRREESRGSTSASPYSPRSGPLGRLSIGAVRGPSTLARDKRTPTPSQSSLTQGWDTNPVSELEALPSAGLRGMNRNPFEGILPDDSPLAMLRD